MRVPQQQNYRCQSLMLWSFNKSWKSQALKAKLMISYDRTDIFLLLGWWYPQNRSSHNIKWYCVPKPATWLQFSVQPVLEPSASHLFVLTFVTDYFLNWFSSCNVTPIRSVTVQMPCKNQGLASFQGLFLYLKCSFTLLPHSLWLFFSNMGFGPCVFLFHLSLLSSIFFPGNLVKPCFIYLLYKSLHIWLVNLFYF